MVGRGPAPWQEAEAMFLSGVGKWDHLFRGAVPVPVLLFRRGQPHPPAADRTVPEGETSGNTGRGTFPGLYGLPVTRVVEVRRRGGPAGPVFSVNAYPLKPRRKSPRWFDSSSSQPPRRHRPGIRPTPRTGVSPLATTSAPRINAGAAQPLPGVAAAVCRRRGWRLAKTAWAVPCAPPRGVGACPSCQGPGGVS